MTPTPPVKPLAFGDFRGECVARHLAAGLEAWLRDLEPRLRSGDGEVLWEKRNRLVRLPFPAAPDWGGVCVKQFAVPSWWRGHYYGRFPSKAERAFHHALHLWAHGVGVAEPVAYFQRFAGGRLGGSFFVARHLGGRTDFDRELAGLLGQPAAVAFVRRVAGEVRRMHDSGFAHLDLGGQNILLRRRDDGTWGDFAFIDLNRGRRLGALTSWWRARDIARLRLPAEVRAAFLEAYFGGSAPAAFLCWEGLCRWRMRLHRATSPIRHPLRAWRGRASGTPSGGSAAVH